MTNQAKAMAAKDAADDDGVDARTLARLQTEKRSMPWQGTVLS
jgi:hypothetical protein